MKHIKTRIFITLLLLCCCTFLHAESPKYEFRAAYISTVWNLDWPSSKNLTATEQQTELRNIFDQLQAANFNAVCLQVRNFSDALYDSPYEPWSSCLTGERGKYPGYDPLEYAIQEAHKRGLELHAWVNPYRYSTSKSTYSTSCENDYANTQSEWIMRASTNETLPNGKENSDYYNTILNPGIPAVRNRIALIIEDIVTRYDVDGVIFDDYFYINGKTLDVYDNTYYSSNNPNNLSRADWRRDQVNQMVAQVYNTIKGKKPYVRFGIAPAGVAGTSASKYGLAPCPIGSDWQYNGLYSDPLAWVASRTVDYISPQIYWEKGHATNDYTQLCQWWSYVANTFDRHFFSSQTLSPLAPYNSENNPNPWEEQEIIDQIKINRESTQNNAAGCILFDIPEGLSPNPLVSTLQEGLFSTPACLPPMSWQTGETLDAPTNLKLSAANVFSWSHAKADRFTVYAYTKGTNSTNAMADPTNLVGVVYGNSITLSNVSGKTLAVCAYDRYGKEHLAAFYNKGDVNPTITASVENIILIGEKDVTPAPYVDVEITASDLSHSMTYNPSTGSVVVTPMDDWNAATGGTLRVSLNATFANGVGQYSGILAVQSGSTEESSSYKRIEIPISATITTPIPAISVSTTSASFEFIEGESAESQDIIVTAKGLIGNITITNNNVALSYTTVDWSNKGGTLRLTLDASKSAGTYTGNIILSNGSVSAEISTSVVINEKKQGFLWRKTLDDLGIQATQCRRMAIDDNGMLYLSSYLSGEDACYFTGVPTTSTISLTSHRYTGLTNALHGMNLRVTDDGYILVGNSGWSSPITIYTVNSGTATQKSTITTTQRTDYFTTYGSWMESGYILALEQGTRRIIKLPFSHGSLATSITEVIAPAEKLAASNQDKVYPIDNESFYACIKDKPITKNSLVDGSEEESFKDERAVTTSGLAVFTIHNHKYMVAPVAANGSFEIFDITDGLKNAVSTEIMGQSTLSISHGVEFCTRIVGNNVFLYVLDPNNGLEAYQYTFLPDPTITASSQSVTLSGEQGASNVYKDITITGISLTNDITITNSNSAISYACVGWNARTGGTLRITLDTQKEIGTYTGDITLMSGTLSTTIAVTAVVEEEKQEDETPFVANKPLVGVGVLNENAIWKEQSVVDAGGNVRSIAYYNNLLYVHSKSGKLYTVNPANGSKISEVATTLTDYHGWNVRVTSDGRLFGGNTNAGSTTDLPLQLYELKTTGETQSLTTNATVANRSDYFYTYGSFGNDGYLLALANAGTSVTKIPFVIGQLGEPEYITLTGANVGSVTAAKAIPAPDGKSFYVSNRGAVPTQHDFTGAKIGEFGSKKPVPEQIETTSTYKTTSGLAVFKIHGRTYMVVALHTLGKFDMFDITEGLASASRVAQIDPAFTTANGSFTVDFAVDVKGNNAFIYVLVPYNGIAAYQFTFTPFGNTYDNVFTGGAGIANPEWSNAFNWSNGVPDADDNILIEAPCMVDDDVAVHSIHLLKSAADNDASLTIAPTAALTVQTTIRRVTDDTFPPTQRYYTATSDIVIQADANGNQGVLAYFGEGKTKATVELYGVNTVKPENTGGTDGVHIPWQYVAMPFAVEKAEETEFAGSWITEWDEVNGKWSFKNGGDVTLHPWTGYALIQEAPTKYTLTGTLQEPSTTLIDLKMRTSNETAYAGSNFVGNSWTAPLQIDGFDKDKDFVNTKAVIYLHYNQFTNGTATGEAYHTIPVDEVEKLKANGVPVVINPLQGFFVKGTSASGGLVTLDYARLVLPDKQSDRNTLRVAQQGQVPQTSVQPMAITVTADDGLYAKVFLLEGEDYTTAFDNGSDAHKMRDSKAIPYLAAASSDGDMAVLATPVLHGTYLTFEKGSGVRYTFTFSYTGSERLYLLDALTGISTEIRAGSSYTFSPTDDDHYRFRLSRKTIQEGALDEIDMWANGRKLYFTNSLGLPTDVVVYGVDGRMVEHVVTHDRQHLLSVPSAGVYVICVSNEQGIQTMQVIL